MEIYIYCIIFSVIVLFFFQSKHFPNTSGFKCNICDKQCKVNNDIKLGNPILMYSHDVGIYAMLRKIIIIFRFLKINFLPH